MSRAKAWRKLIKEDLVAERVAIDSYGEMIRYLGDRDPTTRRMLETILAAEEEHAEDLASLLCSNGVSLLSTCSGPLACCGKTHL